MLLNPTGFKNLSGLLVNTFIINKRCVRRTAVRLYGKLETEIGNRKFRIRN
jgi:hypothetical protein